MLFDVQAALAEILSEPPPATVATTATNRAIVAEVASVAGATAPKQSPGDVVPFIAQPSAPKPSRHDVETFPNGLCRHTGRHRTWAGKVVALEEWRGLSTWERNGPAGRLFCGTCREWVPREGGCALPGCWKGGLA